MNDLINLHKAHLAAAGDFGVLCSILKRQPQTPEIERALGIATEACANHNLKAFEYGRELEEFERLQVAHEMRVAAQTEDEREFVVSYFVTGESERRAAA